MTDHDLSSLKRDLTIARRTCSYTGITHIISGLVESLIDSRMDSDFSESEERARAVVELLDAATEESGSPTILPFSGDCLTVRFSCSNLINIRVDMPRVRVPRCGTSASSSAMDKCR